MSVQRQAESGEEIKGTARARREEEITLGKQTSELMALSALGVLPPSAYNMSLDMNSSHSQLGGLLIQSSAALLACHAAVGARYE